MAASVEQQESRRGQLHHAILEAVRRYEEATGWKVTRLDYEPSLNAVAAEVESPARPPRLLSDLES